MMQNLIKMYDGSVTPSFLLSNVPLFAITSCLSRTLFIFLTLFGAWHQSSLIDLDRIPFLREPLSNCRYPGNDRNLQIAQMTWTREPCLQCHFGLSTHYDDIALTSWNFVVLDVCVALYKGVACADE
jgi:hypothetical protein